MKDFNVRDQVQSAAVALFAEKGYATTSVQEVVARAGVTKGAMYHYFRSKDDLLFGIYERMLELQKDHLDEIVARGLSTHDTLRTACIDVVETSIDFLPEGTVFFRSVHMLAPERQQEVTRRRREYNDTFAEIVKRGQAEGLYRTDIPIAVLVANFFSDVHYLSNWYSTSGAETKTQVAEQITDLFLKGIST